MHVKHTELENWKRQIVEDNLAWAKDVNGVKNPKTLEAFKAGLQKGMTELVSTLKLHDKLVVK